MKFIFIAILLTLLFGRKWLKVLGGLVLAVIIGVALLMILATIAGM